MSAKLIAIEQSRLQDELNRLQHEQRMMQLRSETEQLRQLNASGRALLSSIDQLCFAPDSSLIPPLPTASDCKPSSP
ncbi:MAG: hypothetical protein ACKOZT_07090 [Cyanobium sp.]